MKILTKKKELRLENRVRDTAMSLAHAVYEKTLEWQGVNMAEPIRDRHPELREMMWSYFKDFPNFTN